MKKYSFSKEPIVWIGFIIAALMVLSDFLNGELSAQSLDALLVAAGAVIGRKFVAPVEKIVKLKDEDPYA